jgi:hypothetical protein
MKALHLAEPQISAIQRNLENGGATEISGRGIASRIFHLAGLMEAGLEDVASETTADDATGATASR